MGKTEIDVGYTEKRMRLITQCENILFYMNVVGKKFDDMKIKLKCRNSIGMVFAVTNFFCWKNPKIMTFKRPDFVHIGAQTIQK